MAYGSKQIVKSGIDKRSSTYGFVMPDRDLASRPSRSLDPSSPAGMTRKRDPYFLKRLSKVEQ